MNSSIKFFRTKRECAAFLTTCKLTPNVENGHFFSSSRIKYDEVKPMFAFIERVGNNKYAISLNYIHPTGIQSGYMRTTHYLNLREFDFWARFVGFNEYDN